jgi:PTS system mannose-specific IIC component
VFTTLQVVLIILWFTVYNIISSIGFGLPAGGVVLNAVVVGAIMGDPAMGFYLGGTYELMNIGLNPLGGSTVPNYNMGAVVGTAFGVVSGKETGMAIGIVVATLASTLDVFAKTVGSVFLHKAQASIKNHEFKKAKTWIHIGFWPRILLDATLPLLLVFLLGAPLVTVINKSIPAWFLIGFKNAGNILPAMGFAILLRSLNIKGNFQYIIIGFALFAYLKVGALGTACIGLALAMIVYYNNVRFNELAMANGVDEDE